MAIGSIIKNRRLELDMTLEEVANIVGVTRATIQKYENGVIANIPSDKIELIAKALRVSPGYIMGWDEPSETYYGFPTPTIAKKTVKLPIIGEVAAGYEHIVSEDWTGETVEVPEHILHGRDKREYFILNVHGDSMYPEYQDGDQVVVLRQSTMDRSGQIGVVVYNGDSATLKKIEYVTGEDWMKLIPINPAFPPKTIKGADLEQCKVIGIPKVLIRNL